MKFALRTGLMLRCGERRLELSRLLPNDRVQLENVETRQAQSMSVAELVKQIWTGRMSVVVGSTSGTAVEDSSDAAGLPLLDLSSIRESWRKQIEYRLRYLKGFDLAPEKRTP